MNRPYKVGNSYDGSSLPRTAKPGKPEASPAGRPPGGGPRIPSIPHVLAAIDVGTNAIRLEMVRPLPDGTIETLHQERDPVRPGEGLFRTGVMPRVVADRVLATLRRYAALCRRHRARVRAVATSAVREARNQAEIVERVRREAGLELEVISGTEEARLICLGVLHGKPPRARSLCIDVGGGSTEVASALGEVPTNLWSVAIGAVRVTELFDATGVIGPEKLAIMRGYVREAIEEAIPAHIPSCPRVALGSSGTARTVVSFAAAEGTAHATTRQLTQAVDRLARMTAPARRTHFDARRADIVVAGAIILETIARRLSIDALTAVNRGLRHGVLLDLHRRSLDSSGGHTLADAARALGARFGYDDRHAGQVARVALTLFDGLTNVHRLPPSVRPYLEAAALLHDIGNTVSYQKHHRHTQYLIQNADLPGLADHERSIVACVARFHRRSEPELGHPAMGGLRLAEARLVRKLAALLRIADALDRGHHQPVAATRVQCKTREVVLHVRAKAPIDLELWDLGHEVPLFRRVFRRGLRVEVSRR